jgi:hypothetical protein
MRRSGTGRSVRLLHEVIAAHGTNPSAWLPASRRRLPKAQA